MCTFRYSSGKKNTSIIGQIKNGTLPASIHGDKTQAGMEDDSPAADGRRHARRVSAEGSRRATHARALIVPTLMLVNPHTKLGDPP